MVQKDGRRRNAAEPPPIWKTHPTATPCAKVEDGLPPCDAAAWIRGNSAAVNNHALGQVVGRDLVSECPRGGASRLTSTSDKDASHDRQENETSLFQNMAAACRSGKQPSAVIWGKDAEYWIMTEASPHPRKLLLNDPAVSKLVRDLSIAQGLEDPETCRLKSKLSHTAGGSNRLLDYQSSINPVRNPSQGGKPTFAKEHLEYEDDKESDVAEILECKQVEVDRIRIDEVRKSYYPAAIGTMSQRALKDILTTWIRVCHPGKQSQNPYSGGKLAQRSLAAYGYEGHYTMPSYWPSDIGWDNIDGDIHGCRHKEPYHIKKLESHVLFIHLLQCGSPFNIVKMRESTSTLPQKSPREFPDATMDRLREIYRVRQREVEYENGEIDGDTLITVQALHGRVNRKTSLTDNSTATETKSSRSRPQTPSSTTESLSELVDAGSEYSEASAPVESSGSMKEVNPFAGCDLTEALDLSSQVSTSPAAEETSSMTALTPSTKHNVETYQRPLPTRFQMTSGYTSPTAQPYASTPNDPFVIDTKLHDPIARQGRKRPLSPSTEPTRLSPFGDTGMGHQHQERSSDPEQKTPRRQHNAPQTRQTHIRPSELHQPHPPAPTTPFTFAGSSSGFSGLQTSCHPGRFPPPPQQQQQHAPSIYNPFYPTNTIPEAALPSATGMSLKSNFATNPFDNPCINFDYPAPHVSDQHSTPHFQQYDLHAQQEEQLRQHYPTILASSFESFDVGAGSQHGLMEPDWLDQIALGHG